MMLADERRRCESQRGTPEEEERRRAAQAGMPSSRGDGGVGGDQDEWNCSL